MCGVTLKLCDMTYLSVRHDSFIFVPWRIGECVMPYGWRDLFISATWLILPSHVALMERLVRHDSFQWNECDMTRSNGTTRSISATWLILQMWRDSFIYVTRLIHICAMTHWCVWRALWVAWLIHQCDMTDSTNMTWLFICVPWLVDAYGMPSKAHVAQWRPLPRPHMCGMTPASGWYDSCVYVT